jgi:hypothetical protein
MVKRFRTAEELDAAKQMIAEGLAFCESNTWDGHKATRVGSDDSFYCEDHDENNH